DSDDFRRSYSRWLSPMPRGRPLRIQIKPRRMPEAYLSPPTYLAIPRRRRRDVGHFRRVIDAALRPPARTGGDQREWHAGVRPADRLCKQPHGPTVLQNLIGRGVQGRFGISGIELCDDHHTLPPFFFIALPTHDVAPDKIKRPPQGTAFGVLPRLRVFVTEEGAHASYLASCSARRAITGVGALPPAKPQAPVTRDFSRAQRPFQTGNTGS